MYDITRLKELHATTTQGDWQRCQAGDGQCPCGLVWDANEEIQITVCSPQPLADAMWITESHNAWPAVAAELARLREFAQRVREASRFRDDISVAGTVLKSIDWLAEIKKARAT
jgi:hypothetical protein